MDAIDQINAATHGRSMADEIIRQCRIEMRKNKGNYRRLVKIANGEFCYEWLRLFANGAITNPGFSKLFSLARYLGIRLVAERGPHYNRFDG